MLSRGKYVLLRWTCALAVLVNLSCQEEFKAEEPGNKICFKVSNDTEARTKGEQKSRTLEAAGQKFSVTLEAGKEAEGLQKEPATRGAAYDNGTYLIPSITVSAISEDGDGGNIFFKDEEVSIQEGTGTSERFWPITRLSFLAYSVSKNGINIDPEFTRENGECSASFSYTLPAAMTEGTIKDATNQPDIVFAITPDLAGPSTVDLVFHHALSAINFVIGKMPEDVYIKSIAIGGVYNEGDCSMTAAAGKDIDFVWTFDGGEQDGIYTEELNADAVEGEMMGDDEATFMMLPQTMSDDTKFIMTFSIEGREYVMEKAFNDFIPSWEADKKYVFRIGLSDEIDVEVDDNVEGFVKNNVTIQNTGIATGYIRAAIVGYWVNSSGKVCAPLDNSEGTFAYGSEWNTYWKKGNDGFYYHLLPVEHNEYTYPLFSSYTLNESVKESHITQTLEIDIAVQIIPISEKAVWSELDSVPNP